MGTGTDSPPEKSRTIPNLVPRHWTKEISIEWGFQPFERGNPGTIGATNAKFVVKNIHSVTYGFSDIYWLK
jgi:hypothetical protein